MTQQDRLEALISTVVDAEPLFDDPVLGAGLVFNFTTDIAEAIHSPEVIARRYGFSTPEKMVEFIQNNREVRKRIKEKRALYDSNVSIEVRNRKQAGHVVNEAMASMAAPMFDRSTPAAVRLDTLKVFSRMAGIDGVPAASRDGPVAGGAGFTVNFMFSGGQTQTLTATPVGDTTTTVVKEPLMPVLADLGDDA